MNKRQKIVQEQFLNNEKVVISRLKKVYDKSLEDITKKAKELQNQIDELNVMIKLAADADEAVKLKSMQQSKVYQKQYQDALKKQVSSILDNLQVEEFKTVDAYLKQCYEDGFIGVMYDLQGQGIPLCFPLDQESMVRAVQLDSKISEGLYKRLGEDITKLKKKITAQVSRGISTGVSYAQVAQQLAGYTNIGFNNAVRIARTEGHRIQVQSGMDACYKAQDMGADVVKQWDSTLDGKTRPSHRKVDGEIRELDEPFSNGLMFPGDPDGGAAEVVNCRCALLQRARWALDDDELRILKDRAAYFGLDKTENFKDYKKKYLKTAEIINKPLENLVKNDNIGLSKASAIFVNNKEILHRNAQKVEKIDGYEDIVCHGTPDLFGIDIVGKGNESDFMHLTPKEFAEKIRKSNGYNGGNIRLISCQSGAKDNGAAQKLADELNVKVYAPTEIVNIDEDGRIFVTDNEVLADMWYNAPESEKDKFTETGEWKVFEPRKEK